ncbi:MAG: hypothetical protein Q8L81_17760 [Bacteroidota bacterium]|nr:hypothetical protein [Bacteroidota bacterium]
MLQKFIEKKYKASTLPEVMIALAITSFCTTLAVIIYLNIQQSTLPFIKMKSNELAVKYLNETVIKKDFIDNSYSEEEFTIKKVIVRNTAFSDCVDITITVFNINKKKLSQLQTTLYAD